MSFGRRLALFFVLIVLVPTLVLVGMLVIVSEDSRQGKADARLAAGLETALALYGDRVAEARSEARALGTDPALAEAVRSGSASQLEAFVAEAARDPELAAVEVLGPADTLEAGAGSDEAIAFGEVQLEDQGSLGGTLRVSVTTAPEFATEVRRLTQRELVLAGDGTTLASTVEAPALDLEPGETVDLELPEGEFRAHLVPLDEADGEWLLLLGPRKEGGFLAIDRSTVALLLGFLLIAIVLAYALARTLTGLHSQVAEQAITDPLTGLWNRRRMDRGVAQEVDRSLRFGHHLSVLIVDVDDFKRINDDHGHPTGDMVLRRIADVVRSTTRSIDFTARYGGDELALILLETGPQGAAVLAERLRTNVREKRILGRDGTRAVTISVGVATLPDSAEDPASLIEAADQALLAAKRAGKDQTRSAPGRPRPRAPAGEGPRGRGDRGGNGRLGSRRRPAR